MLGNGGHPHEPISYWSFDAVALQTLGKLVFTEIRYVYVVYLKGLCRDTGRCQRYFCGA